MTAAETRPRRAYQSPRRRQQAVETRAAVIDAATRIFAERGWAATAVRDVAREAGVSVETVYAGVGSKSDLLMAAIDVAVVGDAEPVPLGRREAFSALGRGDRRQRNQAAARLVTQIHSRTAGLNLALREAAASAPALDRLMRKREEARRDDVQRGMALVADRPVTGEEVDALWAILDVGLFRMLTDLRGWSPDQYQAWLAETIGRLLDDVRRD